MQVDVSARSCIFLAVLLLVVPLPWILAAVTAAGLHELGHILAVLALGGRIHSLKIRSFGAQLLASPMTPVRELVCILAGPGTSLLLMCALRWMPEVAVCGMIQGLFNLIPVYPLDGGRALGCLTELYFSPEAGRRLCSVVKYCVIALIFVVSFWLFVSLKLGFCVIVGALFLLSRILAGKIPCKDRE